MEQFLARHAEHVIGTLSGFARLVFRGTSRMQAHCGGMMTYWTRTRGVLYCSATGSAPEPEYWLADNV